MVDANIWDMGYGEKCANSVLTLTLASVRLVHMAISSRVLMSGYRFRAKVASSSWSCWEVKWVRCLRCRFLFLEFLSPTPSSRSEPESPPITPPLLLLPWLWWSPGESISKGVAKEWGCNVSIYIVKVDMGTYYNTAYYFIQLHTTAYYCLITLHIICFLFVSLSSPGSRWHTSKYDMRVNFSFWIEFWK